jgi:hypothetical protein
MESNEMRMVDTIHKCLFCGSPAYEVAPNEFKCSSEECGLIWRIIDCES